MDTGTQVSAVGQSFLQPGIQDVAMWWSILRPVFLLGLGIRKCGGCGLSPS